MNSRTVLIKLILALVAVVPNRVGNVLAYRLPQKADKSSTEELSESIRLGLSLTEPKITKRCLELIGSDIKVDSLSLPNLIDVHLFSNISVYSGVSATDVAKLQSEAFFNNAYEADDKIEEFSQEDIVEGLVKYDTLVTGVEAEAPSYQRTLNLSADIESFLNYIFAAHHKRILFRYIPDYEVFLLGQEFDKQTDATKDWKKKYDIIKNTMHLFNIAKDTSSIPIRCFQANVSKMPVWCKTLIKYAKAEYWNRNKLQDTLTDDAKKVVLRYHNSHLLTLYTFLGYVKIDSSVVSQHSGLYGDIVANICYLQDSENISTGNLVQRKNIKMTLENVIDQLIAHENVNRALKFTLKVCKVVSQFVNKPTPQEIFDEMVQLTGEKYYIDYRTQIWLHELYTKVPTFRVLKQHTALFEMVTETNEMITDIHLSLRKDPNNYVQGFVEKAFSTALSKRLVYAKHAFLAVINCDYRTTVLHVDANNPHSALTIQTVANVLLLKQVLEDSGDMSFEIKSMFDADKGGIELQSYINLLDFSDDKGNSNFWQQWLSVNASIGKPLLKLIDMGNQNIEIVHTGFKEMWPLVNTSLKQRYAFPLSLQTGLANLNLNEHTSLDSHMRGFLNECKKNTAIIQEIRIHLNYNGAGVSNADILFETNMRNIFSFKSSDDKGDNKYIRYFHLLLYALYITPYNVRQVLHTPTQRNVLVTSNALLVTIPMKLGFMNAKEDMTSVLRHVENALQTEPHSKQSVGTYNGLQHNFDQLKRQQCGIAEIIIDIIYLVKRNGNKYDEDTVHTIMEELAELVEATEPNGAYFGGILECGLSEIGGAVAVADLQIDEHMKTVLKKLFAEADLICPLFDNLLRSRRTKSWEEIYGPVVQKLNKNSHFNEGDLVEFAVISADLIDGSKFHIEVETSIEIFLVDSIFEQLAKAHMLWTRIRLTEINILSNILQAIPKEEQQKLGSQIPGVYELEKHLAMMTQINIQNAMDNSKRSTLCFDWLRVLSRAAIANKISNIVVKNRDIHFTLIKIELRLNHPCQDNLYIAQHKYRTVIMGTFDRSDLNDEQRAQLVKLYREAGSQFIV